jgi:ubiquinone/menaquinone biosynthesis C-methylase UbiE
MHEPPTPTQILRAPYAGKSAENYEDRESHGFSDEQSTAWRRLFRTLLPTGITQPSVLDLGCGTGISSRELHSLGCDVTAIDCAPDMLEVARRHGPSGIRYLAGDVEHLDLPSHGFDAIFGLRMAGYLTDPIAAFTTWRSLLRPGGTIALFDGYWSPDGWADAVTEPARADVVQYIRTRLPLASQNTPATLVYLLKQAGFRNIEALDMSAVDRANTGTSHYGVRALTD